MRRKITARGAIVVFWISAMLCLARYETFPELFTHSLRGYRGILDETVLMQETWSRIVVGGIPAGYSHTNMSVDDEGPQQNIEIHNRTHIKAALLGQPVGMHANTTLLLDPDYNLLNFESAVSAQGISIRASGTRVEDRQYDITTHIGSVPATQRIEIPKDVILYSPVSALALRRLRPGRELTIKTLAPLSMTTARVRVKAIRRETLDMPDGPKEATLLSSNYHGMQLQSWVDKHGTLLRQETPLGWIIESCPPEIALDAVTGDHAPPDLLLTQGAASGLMQLLLGGAQGVNP